MNGMPLLLFLVTFLAVWEFPPSGVLAQSAHHAQLIEGAKKEGAAQLVHQHERRGSYEIFGVVQ